MRSRRTKKIILAGTAALTASLVGSGCGWHSVSVRHGHGYHGPRHHHRVHDECRYDDRRHRRGHRRHHHGHW